LSTVFVTAKNILQKVIDLRQNEVYNIK